MAKPEKESIQAQNLEIERKFLLPALPNDTDKFVHYDILQGYLVFSNEAEDGKERRVRSKGGEFYYAEKKGKGKVREENEHSITKEEFDSFWPQTEGKRISKTRYEIPLGKYIVEVDAYHESLEGLVVAEVEFDSEVESDKFAAPDWFGLEVTENMSYTNRSLIQNGLPQS